MDYVAPQPLEAWDQFCYYSKFFDDATCDQVVALARDLPFEEAKVATAADQTDTEDVRRSRIRWLPSSDAFQSVYERVAQVMLAANAARWHFDVTGFSSPIQFSEYAEVGSRYDWHTDIGAGTFSTRKLSCTIQLSDEETYVGGEFEVFRREPMDDVRETLRGRGTMIVFPAYILHRVSPVESGCRLSLVAWLDGPPYR